LQELDWLRLVIVARVPRADRTQT